VQARQPSERFHLQCDGGRTTNRREWPDAREGSERRDERSSVEPEAKGRSPVAEHVRDSRFRADQFSGTDNKG